MLAIAVIYYLELGNAVMYQGTRHLSIVLGKADTKLYNKEYLSLMPHLVVEVSQLARGYRFPQALVRNCTHLPKITGRATIQQQHQMPKAFLVTKSVTRAKVEKMALVAL